MGDYPGHEGDVEFDRSTELVAFLRDASPEQREQLAREFLADHLEGEGRAYAGLAAGFIARLRTDLRSHAPDDVPGLDDSAIPKRQIIPLSLERPYLCSLVSLQRQPPRWCLCRARDVCVCLVLPSVCSSMFAPELLITDRLAMGSGGSRWQSLRHLGVNTLTNDWDSIATERARLLSHVAREAAHDLCLGYPAPPPLDHDGAPVHVGVAAGAPCLLCASLIKRLVWPREPTLKLCNRLYHRDCVIACPAADAQAAGAEPPGGEEGGSGEESSEENAEVSICTLM